MAISTDELLKATTSLEEAVLLYSKAVPNSLERKAFRDASIQRFEYCVELAWKVSMKVLGSTTAAAKPAVREMARNNLIADPSAWIDFIDARNNSSHSYDEDVAQKVFVQIQKFIPEVRTLLGQLKKNP